MCKLDRPHFTAVETVTFLTMIQKPKHVSTYVIRNNTYLHIRDKCILLEVNEHGLTSTWDVQHLTTINTLDASRPHKYPKHVK